MPTLSVVAVHFEERYKAFAFRYADGSVSCLYPLNEHYKYLAENLDSGTWLALRKAMLTPDTWITAEG